MQPSTPSVSADTAPTIPTFTLPVDPEHSGLRLAVVGVFFISAAVLYLIMSALLPTQNGLNIVAIAVAVAGASFLTQATDRAFKRRWLSGRMLEIEGDQIRLVMRGQVQRVIDGAQHVNVLMWRFEVNKRTRIPKGWYMVAIALVQDDLYLPIYTFVSPEDYQTLPYSSQFVKLTGRKQQEDKDMRLAGQQRRLHIAEDARWIEGAEMTKADFLTYVQHLRQQFPIWMPVE